MSSAPASTRGRFCAHIYNTTTDGRQRRYGDDRIKRQLLVNPSELTHLARMFLWSIEFGLLGTPDSYRVYGSGLLSSISECASLYEPGVDIRPYSISVINHDIDFSAYQAQYYVSESHEHMMQVLEEYASRMARRG